jgi:hypothetical protein
VGIAVADAFISRWSTKYRDNLLRPVTCIQHVFDPNWTPLLVTPPFPEYFFEAAEEAAISRLYGGIHFRAAIERGVEQGICVGKRVSALLEDEDD